MLNYESLTFYMKGSDGSKQQTSKAKIQVLNLKKNMEKVRRKFLERSKEDEGPGHSPIKVCCVRIEDVFSLPDPEVTEIKDIKNSFGGYMDFPDPMLYLFVVCDLRDSTESFNLTVPAAVGLTTADSLLK